MLDGFKGLLKKFQKKDSDQANSGDAAKERLHMVLMQDRANVSADYIDLMKQDIIDDIKKYVEVDEKDIDVRLTNQIKNDGSNGAPALYANIPITGIKTDKKNLDKNKKNGNTVTKKTAAKNSILGDAPSEVVVNNTATDEESKVVKKATARKSTTAEKTVTKAKSAATKVEKAAQAKAEVDAVKKKNSIAKKSVEQDAETSKNKTAVKVTKTTKKSGTSSGKTIKK